MYSIGDPGNPKPSNPRFDTQEEAECKAIEASWDDQVWAVWEDESGAVLALVFDQTIYSP